MDTLKKIFEYVLGVPYKERQINYVDENIGRKDELYEILTKKYFYSKNKDKLLKIADKFIKTKDITFMSLASYIYALNHKWEEAIKTMEKIIYLENWKNIDSWIDLALFLRKISKYEDLSLYILFNLEKVVVLNFTSVEIVNKIYLELKNYEKTRS